MFWLITETGTYQKTYVVQSSRPLEKPESLVDGSFSCLLPEDSKLIGKLVYSNELINEKDRLDFSVRKAIGLLSSIEDLEPVVTKPKRPRKRPEQAEQLEKPVQAVEPKPKRPRNKVDWSSVTE